MFEVSGTINPGLTVQGNNDDLHSFFTDVTMVPSSTGNTPSWGMDQFLDYPGYSSFPFAQQNSSSYGFLPQATDSFVAMNPANMIATQTQANGQQFPTETANPSALMNSSHIDYSTHQAPTSTEEKPRDTSDNTEAAPESPPKKPRKQRKKRSKQISEAEANEKRQKFLDRNKVAAHKCRQRKKEWTDNLQTRVQMYQLTNDMHRAQILELYGEMEQLKFMVKEVHSAPPHAHTCKSQHYMEMEKKWQKFLKDEVDGFSETANRHLANIQAGRREVPTLPQFSEQGAEAMSRKISMQSNQSNHSNHSVQSVHSAHSVQSVQSTQSSVFQQRGPRSERNDSGVSVGTPEDALKSLGTPKMAVDEGVDVGNGQNFFGQVSTNQRLSGVWNGGHPALPSGQGPIDLNDPMVFISTLR